MENYALTWRKEIKIRSESYDDFVSQFEKLTGGRATFLEKIDGRLGVLVYREGKETFLQSTTGKETTNIPVISEHESVLKKLKVKEAIIVGELVGQKGGVIFPWGETESVVKRSYIEANRNLIHHYLVDVISINGKKFNFSQALKFIFKNYKPELAHLHVPVISSGGLSDFRKFYNNAVKKQGIEGVVVRTKDKIFKVKETDTVDLVVIGAGNKDMPSWPKKQISYLITSFIDKDGNFRSSSKVGTGFTHKNRSALFKFFTENALYEKKGELFVKPQIVVEVKYFKYMLTNTPSFQFKKDEYIDIGKNKSVTFSHPTFVRIRTDKKPTKLDVRLEQVPDFKY